MKNMYCLILWCLLECIDSVLNDCPSTCTCSGSKLECFEDIPAIIPPTTAEISVYEANLGERMHFRDGWSNVTRLSINPGLSSFHNRPEIARSLHAQEFNSLKNLEILQIACKCLIGIEINTFDGLDNLRVLDLRNNINLRVEHLVSGLQGSNILPNLSEMYLSNSSRAVRVAFHMTRKFFNIMKHKHIKVLDISDINNAWFDDNEEFLTAFPFLEKLNLSKTGIAVTSLFIPLTNLNINPNVTSFKRLRSFDISYLEVPYQVTEIVSEPSEFAVFHLPQELSEFYGKRLLTLPFKLPHVTSNSTHMCGFRTGMRRWCYVFKGENLKTLVLSDNSVEYINPHVVQIFPNLQYLDISGNKLAAASSDGFVKIILDILTRLETLSLSKNGIYNLPENTFSQGKNLKVLDLSKNQLDFVTFKTDSLTSLLVLDLSDNRIAFLDETSLRMLNNLLPPPGPMQNSRKVRISLNGNPFLCSCETAQFLKWLTALNESFMCTMDSKEHNIDDFVIQRVEYMCKEKVIVAVFAIFSLTVITLIAVFVYFLVLERRKIRRLNMMRKGIEHFAANEQKIQPVFLSFCSEDDETVMQDIVPYLENGLKKILNTDASCVVTGYNAFRPGFSLANEIIRCVEASSVVVFFITNTFLRKMWCKNETLVAHYENKPIVLMLWEKVDEKLMPKHLYKHYAEHARVHWVEENGQRVMKPGWDELCEAIVRLFAENK